MQVLAPIRLFCDRRQRSCNRGTIAEPERGSGLAYRTILADQGGAAMRNVRHTPDGTSSKTGLPLRPLPGAPEYRVILESEDSHSFGFIMAALQKVLGCSAARAYQLTVLANLGG